MKKEKRFAIKEKESFQGGEIAVIVDRKTGVNYIAVGSLGPQSITPLLGEDGRVVIEKGEFLE